MIALDQKAAAPPAGTGLQKEQAVQRMFSSIARYYDLNNSLLSLGLHHQWKRKTIEFLVAPPHPDPLPPGAREKVKLVLDVGAGTADLALLAARRLGEKAR